jgi:hypothetical protein
MPILLMSKWYMQRKQVHIYPEAQIVNSHNLAGRGGNRYNWSFNNRMK